MVFTFLIGGRLVGGRCIWSVGRWWVVGGRLVGGFKETWNRLHWQVFWKKHKDVSKAIKTAKMELFVALVSSFQPLISFTKNPNIGVMGILNAPV